jgi:hypothetical protein
MYTCSVIIAHGPVLGIAFESGLTALGGAWSTFDPAESLFGIVTAAAAGVAGGTEASSASVGAVITEGVGEGVDEGAADGAGAEVAFVALALAGVSVLGAACVVVDGGCNVDGG